MHVDDVASAAVGALTCSLPTGEVLIANLAAPDNSPRWNQYLIGMGVALGATPVGPYSAMAIETGDTADGCTLACLGAIVSPLEGTHNQHTPCNRLFAFGAFQTTTSSAF